MLGLELQDLAVGEQYNVYERLTSDNKFEYTKRIKIFKIFDIFLVYTYDGSFYTVFFEEVGLIPDKFGRVNQFIKICPLKIE